MDVVLHQVANRVVDHTLSEHSAAALEGLRHDENAVMPATAAGTGMTGMKRAVVADLERGRRKANREGGADPFDRVAAHGSVFRNGRTVVRTNTPWRT